MSEDGVEGYIENLTPVGIRSLAVLSALEAAQRRLHPPLLPELKERLAPVRDELAEALSTFGEYQPPEEGGHPEGVARTIEKDCSGVATREPGSNPAEQILRGERLCQ